MNTPLCYADKASRRYGFRPADDKKQSCWVKGAMYGLADGLSIAKSRLRVGAELAAETSHRARVRRECC